MACLQDNVLGVLREMGKAHVFDSPVIPKENVRKTRDDREKSTQKSQLPKRITRSMQRASRHMVNILIVLLYFSMSGCHFLKNANKLYRMGMKTRLLMEPQIVVMRQKTLKEQA